MLKKKSGFTLIELLVVIAIIGILAAVVLASLNDARDEGIDANIKQSVGQIRAQAELVYNASTTLSYDEVCNEPKVQELLNAAAALSPDADLTATFETSATPIATAGDWDVAVCHSDPSGWVAASPMKDSASGAGVLWCTDSTGFVGQDDAVGATDLTCN